MFCKRLAVMGLVEDAMNDFERGGSTLYIDKPQIQC